MVIDALRQTATTDEDTDQTSHDVRVFLCAPGQPCHRALINSLVLHVRTATSPHLKSGSCLRSRDRSLSPRNYRARLNGESTRLGLPAAIWLLACSELVIISGVNRGQGELLGSGAYGRVYQALNFMTGQLMAVKQVTVHQIYAVPCVAYS